MFCSKCGKQLADDANFCPGCGAVVKKDEAVLEVKPAEAEVTESKLVNTAPKAKGKKKKLIKILVLLVIIAAAIILTRVVLESYSDSVIIKVEAPDPATYFGIPFDMSTDSISLLYTAKNLPSDPTEMVQAYQTLLTSKYGYYLDRIEDGTYNARTYKRYALHSKLGWFDALIDEWFYIGEPYIIIEVYRSKFDSYELQIHFDTNRSIPKLIPAEIYGK